MWWLWLACVQPMDPAPAVAEVPSLLEAMWGGWAVAPSEPDALWDQLATALTGEALTEGYAQTWTALRRMETEQITLEVLRVDTESVRALTRKDGVWVEADWAVGGKVTHRGHVHVRTNRYRGRLRLESTANGWRVAELALADAERVRTLLDGDWLLDELPRTEAGTLDLLDL